jgi:hypothetical protein
MDASANRCIVVRTRTLQSVWPAIKVPKTQNRRGLRAAQTPGTPGVPSFNLYYVPAEVLYLLQHWALDSDTRTSHPVPEFVRP